MGKRSKRYQEMRNKVDYQKKYTLEEALSLVKETALAKFDETVEISVNLGIDPRHADQMVRGTVVLPHGVGKPIRVLVFAQGEKEKEAEESGADFVGGEELIEKVQKGWLDFDKAIATPDMMSKVGKLGKILGPRGLMPNPKTETVTFDVAHAVKEIKLGKIDFKVDKGGVVHSSVGKVSFEHGKLCENALAFLEKVIKLKPATSKGQYLKGVALSSSMGPGIKVDVHDIKKVLKA